MFDPKSIKVQDFKNKEVDRISCHVGVQIGNVVRTSYDKTAQGVTMYLNEAETAVLVLTKGHKDTLVPLTNILWLSMADKDNTK